MTQLSLTVTPKNASVICNVTYSGPTPSEYLIFYYRSGSKIVKSISSVSASNITISNLTNGQTYYFYACIYLSSYSSGTEIIMESAKVDSMPSDLPTQPNLSATVSSSGNDIQNTVILSYGGLSSTGTVCEASIASFDPGR